jgi:hypothetical protein
MIVYLRIYLSITLNGDRQACDRPYGLCFGMGSPPQRGDRLAQAGASASSKFAEQRSEGARDSEENPATPKTRTSGNRDEHRSEIGDACPHTPQSQAHIAPLAGALNAESPKSKKYTQNAKTKIDDVECTNSPNQITPELRHVYISKVKKRLITTELAYEPNLT